MGRLVIAQGTVNDLARIADWLNEQVLACGFEARVAFKIQMAVDEACSNVFTHAYETQAGRIELETSCVGPGFEIRIRDWGRPFDPESVPPPDTTAPLDQRTVGGLGIFFIRQFMDEVSFTFDATEGNELRMRKAR